MKIFFGLLLAAFSTSSLHAEDDCYGWFQKSKIKPGSAECEIKCNLIDTDMATFMCPNRCDEFCIPPPDCAPDKFWLNQIRAGKPPGWTLQSETVIPLSAEDRKFLLNALGQLPDELKIKRLDGIYRLDRSVETGNPGTVIGHSIALYNRAFHGPYALGHVLIHELGHIWFSDLSTNQQKSYYNVRGWHQDSGSEKFEIKAGNKFVDGDAKYSPFEDFAANLDTFLFHPDELKAISPESYKWIKSHFSENFKLKQECHNEKK